MDITVKSENFNLQISNQENNDKDSLFTYLNIQLQSDSFCMSADMEIYTEDADIFYHQMAKLLAELEGCAQLKEPYGKGMYITFRCNKKGHIIIEGLFQTGNDGATFITEFSGETDQSAVNIAGADEFV